MGVDGWDGEGVDPMIRENNLVETKYKDLLPVHVLTNSQYNNI